MSGGPVYLAGPMTGFPRWNFDAFEEWTARLRAAGLAVVSPHEIDLEGGFDPASDGRDFDLEAALLRDLEEVEQASAVALLDGWEHSAGAVLEVVWAEAVGTPARPVAEFV